MMRISLTVAGLVAFATMTQAAEPSAGMQSFVTDHVMGWAQAGVLVDAIHAQNAATAGHDAAHIDTLDQAWRAEVGTANTPTIDAVLFNAASDYLREQVDAMGGMVTEIFVMDAVGLNVAASAPTSDYWQGDEAKWQETYAVGAEALM